MKANQIRQSYINFFVKQRHKEIPPAPLIPPDDPTTLFNGSGMQQLVPYLKGQPHPMGKRLVDSQPSIRAQDIEEVGDNRHTTFFEMLGNWSLGDYFKSEQLPWFWQFLTKKLNLPKEHLAVTISAGGHGIPKDTESYKIWRKLGLPKDRIVAYDIEKENWWSRAGSPDKMPPGEIGGPDSEVFFEFTQVKHNPQFGKTCHPNCDCGRFLEIGNSVFMEYEKQAGGGFKKLPKKNVDFGGGLERLAAVSLGTNDVFKTDLFQPIIKVLLANSNTQYNDNPPAFRRIADHLRGSIMLAAEDLLPSNKEQGSVMRRLIRRSMVSMRQIGIDYTSASIIKNIVAAVAQIYEHPYPYVQQKTSSIIEVLTQESNQFAKVLDRGINKLKSLKNIDGKVAFDLYQSYGLPLELTQELLSQMNKSINEKQFAKQFHKHQQISRGSSHKKFKGGLADRGEGTVKLHTATHLLHQALRQILGDHIHQEGSNITSDRLRFDFRHSQALTEDQISKVEKLVNQKISEDLPVQKTVEDKAKALKSGALAFFREKYPDKVSVYTIGKDPKKDWFSRELCGGPHVSSTAQIGTVKINKQQSIGGGIRRIYAVLSKKS